MARSTFRLITRMADPRFLELPWHLALDEWSPDLVVEMERGIGRHVVRFIELGGAFYALKELPGRLAEREYRLLHRLDGAGIAAVESVGTVAERQGPAGEELSAVLITRYLEFSLPLRLLIARGVLAAPSTALLDAFAELLVRLHLTGFFWGDCSLSNVLFRRDAGDLSAHIVDAETGELHEQLSAGQRAYDLEIAEENLIGELYDLAAELGRQDWPDPSELAANVRLRYKRLWQELTEDEVFGPGEGERLESRLRRMNELGFDAEEVEIVKTPDEYRLRLHSRQVEPGHHRRRLAALTGLHAQENQARRLLADLAAFRARLEAAGEDILSETAVAGRWLAEMFEPMIAAIPAELRRKRAAAEIYHELLEHRWFLSEREGSDVGLAAAAKAYVNDVLRTAPDERATLLDQAGEPTVPLA